MRRKGSSATNVAFRLVTVLCVALALAGCGGRSVSYRYKLTLSLDTPDGVKTGFNVVELRYFEVGMPERGEPHKTKGQAIYIDLGQGRRPLIALLTHIRRADEVASKGHPLNLRWLEDDPSLVLAELCLANARSLSWIETAEKLNERCRPALPITSADLPDLVTFADVNDPKSVMLIDPNNLAATLGPGVTWRSMTLEATDEPLTKAIDEHLPWIRGYNDNMLVSGLKLAWGLHDFVNQSDFLEER